jgi:phytoene/squalene synthetase
MIPVDQAKTRLRAYVAHFADHAEDHLAEISALKPAITGDAHLTDVLEHAIADMQTARRSLQAVLDELQTTPVSDHEHHAH